MKFHTTFRILTRESMFWGIIFKMIFGDEFIARHNIKTEKKDIQENVMKHVTGN